MTEIITTENILEMLGIVLIEIRAGDRVEYSTKMSDIFHHAPGMIARKHDPMSIYEDMKIIARRHGAEDYLDSLLNHIKNIEKT